MNEHTPGLPRTLPTTQAAEGLPRLRWSVTDLDRLIEIGVLAEDDRVELIGGELVPMAAKGNRHEVVRGAFNNWLRRHLPQELDYHSEPGWRPEGVHYLEPDFLIGPVGCHPTSVPPKDVLLLIEVAQSSLRFDTTTKANVYASLGVREYWVINADTLETRVHRKPAVDGYKDVRGVPPGDALTSLLIASLSVKLGDLGIA
jgi:Uma2 family endonuclease